MTGIDHLQMAKDSLHVPVFAEAHALIAIAEELRRYNDKAEWKPSHFTYMSPEQYEGRDD